MRGFLIAFLLVLVAPANAQFLDIEQLFLDRADQVAVDEYGRESLVTPGSVMLSKITLRHGEVKYGGHDSSDDGPLLCRYVILLDAIENRVNCPDWNPEGLDKPMMDAVRKIGEFSVANGYPRPDAADVSSRYDEIFQIWAASVEMQRAENRDNQCAPFLYLLPIYLSPFYLDIIGHVDTAIMEPSFPVREPCL